MHAHNITSQELSTLITRSHERHSPAPRIECADGTTLSVQAGSGPYSEPRICGAAYYSEVEVGFPSEIIEEIAKYAESYFIEEDDCETAEQRVEWLTGTVYPYTPTETVTSAINARGGIMLGTQACLVDLGL